MSENLPVVTVMDETGSEVTISFQNGELLISACTTYLSITDEQLDILADLINQERLNRIRSKGEASHE